LLSEYTSLYLSKVHLDYAYSFTDLQLWLQSSPPELTGKFSETQIPGLGVILQQLIHNITGKPTSSSTAKPHQP
jgi:hypothetical protein